MIATFLSDPSRARSPPHGVHPQQRRSTDKAPSFTIISNRCAHLGCPVQPNGLVDDKANEGRSRTTKATSRHA